MNRRHFLIATTLAPGGLSAMPHRDTPTESVNGVKFVSPDVVAPPIGNYAHIALVPKDCELIILAGQVGNDALGHIPAEVEKQYENVLTNIASLLRSQGLTPAHVVKVNTYLVQPLDPEKIRGVRQRIFGDVVTPSTMVYVPRLATTNLLIEMEVWAAKRRS
jgi:2-iminobutanoate/2-iminopropanoate deaminase